MNKLKKFIYLLVKSILNPKKFLQVFNKRFLSTPDLNSLNKIKNNYLRKKYFYFWINLSKKNIKFKKLFFEKDNLCKQIFFDYKNSFSIELFFKSLSNNGIVVLENVLPEIEKNKIQNYFDELKNFESDFINSENSKWLTKPKKTANKTKIRIYSKVDLSNFPNLKSINKILTKKIFGLELDSEAEFYLDKCIKVPDEIIQGDNVLHIDRYVPNIKIIYSPFNINNNSAPFSYLVGSHKIDDNYEKMILDNKFGEIKNLDNLNIENKDIKIKAKENSLIVFLANGFHGRTPFYDLNERKLLFLQYNKTFNKLSFLNYKKFNQ